MRVAIVNHVGDIAAGAEGALLAFVTRLPENVEPIFFLLEDGRFANALRERFSSVTIVPMPERVAALERGKLSPAALPQSFDLTLRLSRALGAAQPDIVLTNSMKAHIVGSIAAKLAGLRCVNYLHDFATGPALALLRLVSSMCAVQRMSCSRSVARHVALPRTTAVYPSIDTAAFARLPSRAAARATLGLPNDGLPIVGLVGRIARWKGQDRFVRIAIDVLRDTDAHFAIIGSPLFASDARDVAGLTATVAAVAQGRIHFVPWQDDMLTVYAALDLVCNCSIREPFGRTSLEALASGIPIVCFDDGGVCEIITTQHCGAIVPAGDEIAFADAVRAYLTYPQLLANAAGAAKPTAARFDIQETCRQFADVLRSAAMDRPARGRPRLLGKTESFGGAVR